MSAFDLNKKLIGKEVSVETNDIHVNRLLRKRGNNIFVIEENDSLFGIFIWEEVENGVFLAKDTNFLGQEIWRKLTVQSRCDCAQ